MENIGRESMQLLVECEACHHKFNVGAEAAPNSIEHKKKYVVNDKEIFLTHYDCPECGRRHFVQIDDVHTLNELREVTKMFGKLNAMMKSGKTVSKKQSDKFKKARKHLANNRIKLMKIYTGVSVHDETTDSDFVLRFSV